MRLGIVIHPSYNILGGGERVSLGIIETLSELDVPLEIITFNSGKLTKLFKNKNIQIKEFSFLEKLPTLYSSLFKGTLLNMYLKSSFRNNILIVNTKFNELPTLGHIVYIHFPTQFMTMYNPCDKALTEGPALGKNIKSWYYLYLKSYGSIEGIRSLKLLKNVKVVLFNSIYTFHIFEHILNRLKLSTQAKSLVLNPPIDDQLFKIESNKDNIIVLRIKGLETTYLPKIVSAFSSTMRDWTIYVIGFIDRKMKNVVASNFHYLKNVVFKPDVGELEKIQLLSRAKIYIHPIKYEHFGIIIGEALALNCHVIIHRSSGIFYDILNHYGYRSFDRIKQCITLYDEYDEIPRLAQTVANRLGTSNQCRELAEPFRKSLFKQRVKMIMQDIIEG